MEIVLLAAVDRQGAIGRDNALPWRLPDDLARFKAATLGHPVLMGRKTAESLGRALPGRRNLVLTRSGRVPFDGMEPVASVDAALETARAAGARRLCVIGGGEVYALTLPLADRLSMTEVHTDVADADAFFPTRILAGWREVSRERHPRDPKHAVAFDFVEYVRR